MSFGKLLASGRSLFGEHAPGRYRVNSRISLPKFGSAQNPFVGPAPTGTQSVQCPPRSENCETSKDGSCEATRPTWRDMADRVVTVAGRVNPLRFLKRKRSRLEMAVPRFNEKPVQGELSLDRVQVVRNDLSEADLEIRRVGEEGLRDNAANDGMIDRLAARVFRAETT